MGAGAVSGQSTARSNQVFPKVTSSGVGTDTNNYPSSVSTTNQSSVVSPSRQVATTSGFSSSMPNNKVISCEMCEISFTFFKRKKLCKDCQRFFCSTCLPKPASSLKQIGRQCRKCNILTSGKFTRQQLNTWRVKDMRCFLDTQNVSTTMCKEKHDLIDLVMLRFCVETQSSVQQREHEQLVEQLADRMRNSSFYSTPLPNQVPDDDDDDDDEEEEVWQTRPPADAPPSTTQQEQETTQETTEPETRTADTGAGNTGPSTSEPEGDNSDIFLNDRLRDRQFREMQEAMERLQEELAREQEQAETRPGIQRANIDDLETAEDAENLTVRQLKEILVNNFVDYKGCVEKRELVDRVKRLWNEVQTNRQRTADVLDPPPPATSTETSKPETGEGHKGLDPEHELCKICMDCAIDCILLECGHMVTCTKCGKRLADCPICRQYITRVVHVFRS